MKKYNLTYGDFSIVGGRFSLCVTLEKPQSLGPNASGIAEEAVQIVERALKEGGFRRHWAIEPGKTTTQGYSVDITLWAESSGKADPGLVLHEIYKSASQGAE